MSEFTGLTKSDGPSQPGDNPNRRNAQFRQSVRPKTKNGAPKSQSRMQLSWIDPLPQVDVSMPLGIEPNPEVFPAGEIDLDFYLPTNISQPFADLIESVGDRISLDDDVKADVASSVKALGYFKSARQLYSTMLDHEKSFNQPLKAVYYDETPIPVHMAGAISIIGHMDTKVGKVVIRNASTLFKRWIAHGLQTAPGSGYELPIHSGRGKNSEPEAEMLVWPEEDGRLLAHRLARERINELTNQRYSLFVGDDEHVVSYPKLTDQTLQDYYLGIMDQVPDADQLKDLVSLLIMNKDDWKNGHIANNRDLTVALSHVFLLRAPDRYLAPAMRVAFEEWMASYTVDTKPRVEAILKTAPPPAGSTGFGAQTVTSEGTVARWQFPLADPDVNIGFLFSPMKYFSLSPHLVGYSKRQKSVAAAGFAQQDGKAFV